MHTSKHTPGPWSISGQTGDDWIMASTQGKRIHIARVFEHNPAMGFDDCPPDEEAHANKLLLRAAPDILTALERVPIHRIDETPESFIERFKEWYREERNPALALLE